MSLRLLSEADDEAAEAARWYESQRPGLGDAFLDELARAYQLIEHQPRAFQSIARPPGGREVRRYVLRRFPYRIIYEVIGTDVVVLAVAHTRRQPNYWKGRTP